MLPALLWRSFRYVTEATGTGTLPEVRKRNAIGRYYRTILHHVMLGAHLNQNNVCNLSHHRLTRPIDDVR
jgi:hypothetical protein